MSVRPLVLGLDVSPRRLGWGLVDLETGEAVACGCEPIDLPDHGWSHQQIARALIRPAYAEGPASPYRGEISTVYIEQPGLPPTSGPKSAYSAGRAVQSAHEACERRWPWAEVQYLQPSEWKLLAGVEKKGSWSREAVAGLSDGPLPKSRDLKPEVYAAAVQHGFTPDGHQDAADAGLIALAGQRRNADTWERGEAAA